jgi:hypothetical protein
MKGETPARCPSARPHIDNLILSFYLGFYIIMWSGARELA